MRVKRVRAAMVGATAALFAGCASRDAPPPAAAAAGPSSAAPAVPALPEHWQHGVFMEVFVRAYQDSDGDGIGDLRGLTARLPYLQDLGVRGLWLMPVTPSADRDHGYATTDFRAIEPAYGTLADFDAFVREAAARGIGVIIDHMVNHASAEHPWFVAARQDRAAPERAWFVFRDGAPPDRAAWDIWGANPWYAVEDRPWAWPGTAKTVPPPSAGARDFYFGTFGPHMPDFDWRNPAVARYHAETLDFWLDRGIGGFRLDAVPHLVEKDARDWNDQPESRALTKALVDHVHRRADRFVVCEATAEPRAWGTTEVCGGAFAFGHVHHYAKAAMGERESVAALARWNEWAGPAGARMATFVSNHDRFAGDRLWHQVGGDERRYRLAAAGYLLQPGTPFVYYGEEVGQAQLPGDGDPPLRAPMSWTDGPGAGGFSTNPNTFRPLAPNRATHNVAAQQGDPASLHAFYKAMIGLRNARPSIARGGFEHAFADGPVLGFERVLRPAPGAAGAGGPNGESERTLVLVNYGEQPARLRVRPLAAGSTLLPLFPQAASPFAAAAKNGTARPAADGLTLELPPQSVHVYDVVTPPGVRPRPAQAPGADAPAAGGTGSSAR